jgi:hypothetical protein
VQAMGWRPIQCRRGPPPPSTAPNRRGLR